jgi:signal transduction histidine kinase
MRSRSPATAVRAAVRSLAEVSGGPAAAWLAEGDPSALHLAALTGVGTGRRREFRATFGTLPAWSSSSDQDRCRLFRRLGDGLGLPDVATFGSDEVLLLTGKPDPPERIPLDLVGSLVIEVLRKLSVVRKAERQIRQLDEGIAWAAHELRGPLLGVRAVLESLEREEEGSEAGRAMLRRSERELGRLAALTDGLLRWTVGAEPLHRQWRDVVDVVEEAVDSCRLEAGDDRVTIDAPGPVMARIDAINLRVAVANVVRNALAYSAPGSEVRVRVRSPADRVLIQVRDRGAGVAPQELGAIFDPFVRGEAGRRSSPGGSGLGLFIARRIAEAHGGSILVEASDAGATFTIRLPARPDGRRGTGASTS